MAKYAKIVKIADSPPLRKKIMTFPNKFGARKPDALVRFAIIADTTIRFATIPIKRLRPANAYPDAIQQGIQRKIPTNDGLPGSPVVIPRQASPARTRSIPARIFFIISYPVSGLSVIKVYPI